MSHQLGHGRRLSLSDRRRIDLLCQAAEAGTLLEALGLSAGCSRWEVVRAIRELQRALSAEALAPYELGAYRSRIEAIVRVSGQVLRAVHDPRTSTVRPRWSFRRQTRRYSFVHTVRLSTPYLPRPVDVITEDVSVGGIFVASDTPIPKGASVEVTFDAEHSPVPARVVWRRPASNDNQSGRAGYGLKLEPRNEAERALCRDMVQRAAATQPTPVGPRRRRSRSESAIIGIDFGTTNIYISAARGHRVELLPFADGDYALPSIVNFPQPGVVKVGHEARRRLQTDPRHTIASIKRLLGRQANDRDVANHLAQVTYEFEEGPDGCPLVVMWGERYAIPQLCSYLFSYAKKSAERALGCAVDRAVLSVPVSFTDDQTKMARRAAQLAHLEIVDVVEEPSAAAVANMHHGSFGGTVGVYDFGGGTFDFSVVDVDKGDFCILATAGDSWLGGDDLDVTLASAIASLLWQKHRIDLRNRAVPWQQLVHGCEAAKRALSQSDVARVHVPSVVTTAHGPRDLSYTLQRPQAEALWADLIRRTLVTCTESLSMLGRDIGDLSAIYLSGGTAHLPLVHRALAGLGVPVRTAVSPHSSVCIGAGIYAAQLELRAA